MIIGAQLYTVYDHTRTLSELSETLKKVADIGYTTVQVSGTCDYEAAWLAEELKKNGLSCCITHADEKRIYHDTDKLIAEHDVFGCNYIGVGGFPDGIDSPEDFVALSMPVAEKIRKAGKMFMYHNHHHEYDTVLPDGRNIMEYLADMIPADKMGFTLDLYWAKYAGADPLAEISRLSGRIPCVHLKDMLDAESRKMCPVGSGSVMDYKKIMAALTEAGTEYALVEQDDCYTEDPFDCLKQSYRFLDSLGFR